MLIRDLRPEDIKDCKNIVQYYWGVEIAHQAGLEMEEVFTSHSKWPPHYYVVEDGPYILGFGGFRATLLMSNTYELIWVNVAPEARGKGIGQMLTWHRLAEIRRMGGNLVLLMSQKPEFFKQFQFQTVCVLDGYSLMINQLGPVSIDKDRSNVPQ